MPPTEVVFPAGIERDLRRQRVAIPVEEPDIVHASVQRTAPKIVEVALPADYEDFVPVKAIVSTPLPIPRVEPPIAPVLASARTEPASKHTVNKPHKAR